MKLFNTLSRKLEEFNPSGDTITIYTCGPTVYHRLHIGNLAAAIYGDLLRRSLGAIFPQAEIKHVINITDIDDKTMARSKELYPDLAPMEALTKLTGEVEAQVMADYREVGVDVDNISFIKATDHIKDMQDLIVKLYESGVAYLAEDGIYFSIENYQAKGRIYGQLSKVDLSGSGKSRISNDEYDKEQARDFALWKLKKPGEPFWEFELDGKQTPGRPGWHIECSAMSTKHLGQPFDIHSGGVDLIFPHHENEIAQSTAGEHQALARVFVHHEHLLINDQKMAKSLKNFYTLPDLVNKGYDGLAFRLLVLQGHYQTRTNFTWEALDSAQIRLNKLRNLSARRYQLSAGQSVDYGFVIEAIADNLNTPKLLAGVDSDSGDPSGLVKAIEPILGLGLDKVEDAPDEIKQLILKREQARTSGNYAESDSLRQMLIDSGYNLNDTSDGSVWERVY